MAEPVVGVMQGLRFGLAIIAMLAFRVPGNPAPSIERALVGSKLVP